MEKIHQVRVNKSRVRAELKIIQGVQTKTHKRNLSLAMTIIIMIIGIEMADLPGEEVIIGVIMEIHGDDLFNLHIETFPVLNHGRLGSPTYLKVVIS